MLYLLTFSISVYLKPSIVYTEKLFFLHLIGLQRCPTFFDQRAKCTTFKLVVGGFIGVVINLCWGLTTGVPKPKAPRSRVETPKASRGKGMGSGCPPLQPIRGPGEAS